jgi:phosphoglycerate kinase
MMRFGTAHRAHASTAVIAKFSRLKKDVWFVDGRRDKGCRKVLHSSETPIIAIIGGAKVSDKILYSKT